MTVKGSCHCGETQFEVDEAPASVTRCTCSFCAKRGALWGYYKPAQFRLTDAAGRGRHLSLADEDQRAPFLRDLWLRHLFEVTGLVHRQGGFRPSEDRQSMRDSWTISISMPCRSRSSTGRIFGRPRGHFPTRQLSADRADEFCGIVKPAHQSLVSAQHSNPDSGEDHVEPPSADDRRRLRQRCRRHRRRRFAAEPPPPSPSSP